MLREWRKGLKQVRWGNKLGYTRWMFRIATSHWRKI